MLPPKTPHKILPKIPPKIEFWNIAESRKAKMRLWHFWDIMMQRVLQKNT